MFRHHVILKKMNADTFLYSVCELWHCRIIARYSGRFRIRIKNNRNIFETPDLLPYEQRNLQSEKIQNHMSYLDIWNFSSAKLPYWEHNKSKNFIKFYRKKHSKWKILIFFLNFFEKANKPLWKFYSAKDWIDGNVSYSDHLN